MATANGRSRTQFDWTPPPATRSSIASYIGSFWKLSDRIHSSDISRVRSLTALQALQPRLHLVRRLRWWVAVAAMTAVAISTIVMVSQRAEPTLQQSNSRA